MLLDALTQAMDLILRMHNVLSGERIPYAQQAWCCSRPDTDKPSCLPLLPCTEHIEDVKRNQAVVPQQLGKYANAKERNAAKCDRQGR